MYHSPSQAGDKGANRSVYCVATVARYTSNPMVPKAAKARAEGERGLTRAVSARVQTSVFCVARLVGCMLDSNAIWVPTGNPVISRRGGLGR